MKSIFMGNRNIILIFIVCYIVYRKRNTETMKHNNVVFEIASNIN